VIYHGVRFHPLTLSERTPLKIVFKEQSSGGCARKYRQETVDEKDWDGEFETYDDGRDSGRSRRTGVLRFSMLKVGVALLSKIFARAREDRAFPVRYYWNTPDAKKADTYDLRPN
jgi:hypothetical protein